MELSKNERKGELTAIRTKIKGSTTLRIELLASVIGVLRNHGISVDDRVVSDLIIALPEEVMHEMKEVILPGGTNCGAAH